MLSLFVAILCLSWAKLASGITAVTTTTISPVSRHGRPPMPFLLGSLRGGASSDGSKKKKKKTKGSKGKAKKAIGDAMKEKDSAEALGDAIR